jgi:hypothetical protein
LIGSGVIGFEKLLKVERDPIAVWDGQLFTLISLKRAKRFSFDRGGIR